MREKEGAMDKPEITPEARVYEAAAEAYTSPETATKAPTSDESTVAATATTREPTAAETTASAETTTSSSSAHSTALGIGEGGNCGKKNDKSQESHFRPPTAHYSAA